MEATIPAIDAPATIDELASQLDSKCCGWNLWRTAMGQWVVQIPVAGQSSLESFDGSELLLVLQAALDYVPLPLIPRRPTVYSDDQFTIVKNSHRWVIKINGWPVYNNVATKKMAGEFIKRHIDRHAAAAKEWELKYAATVANGIEGKDFRYEH